MKFGTLESFGSALEVLTDRELAAVSGGCEVEQHVEKVNPDDFGIDRGPGE